MLDEAPGIGIGSRSAYASPSKKLRDAQRAANFHSNRAGHAVTTLDEAAFRPNAEVARGGFDYVQDRPDDGAPRCDGLDDAKCSGGFDFFPERAHLCQQDGNVQLFNSLLYCSNVSLGGGGGCGGYSGVNGDVPMALRQRIGYADRSTGGGFDFVQHGASQEGRLFDSFQHNGDRRGGFDYFQEVDAASPAVGTAFSSGLLSFSNISLGGGGGRGGYRGVDGDLPFASRSSCWDERGRTRHRGPRSREAKQRRQELAPGLFEANDFHILFYNIRGLTSHLAELAAVIRTSQPSPSLICLNETFLDKARENVDLEGFELIARRDRDDGRKCGGIAVFARVDIVGRMAMIEKSTSAERLWMLMHTDLGPFLLGLWYRPPVPGETATIDSLWEEWGRHSPHALGTIMLGDLNIHHKKWLRHSSENTPEGYALRDFCDTVGLQQMVKQPTRGEYLLDLLLSDLEDTKCKVVSNIADHKGLLVSLPCKVPRTAFVTREVWQFAEADWDGLKEAIGAHDWSDLVSGDVHTGANIFTEQLLSFSKAFIPTRFLRERKSTHPWLNERIIELVAAKREAEGTTAELQCRTACSQAILDEYGKYVSKERKALREMPSGKKQWWTRSRQLMERKGAVSSIPALKGPQGQWVFDPNSKADLFVDAFTSKCSWVAPVSNEFSEIAVSPYRGQDKLSKLTVKHSEKVLNELDECSATGPDLLPARILKRCASELAAPILMLTLHILAMGDWPASWSLHWVIPLYKKKSPGLPANYRGIHLTAQVSKVIERLIKSLLMPFVMMSVGFGPNQFAYTPGRGARDVLALTMLLWVQALAADLHVAVYCSDVSGAFDRVDTQRLLAKLRAPKINSKLISVIKAWLQQRTSNVLVGGACSRQMLLKHMLFQGTVLGPTLWNLFFEDARLALNEWMFSEVIYADDLNAFRIFGNAVGVDAMQKSMDNCQQELHAWGAANQVLFDGAKESKHILSLSRPVGGSFKMLGVVFDDTLTMESAISELVAGAGWKLRTLQRTQRYYCDADLVVLYKAHLLSFIEYRTPAIYHAARVDLQKVDQIQERFLRSIGMTAEDALMKFNLAPLRMRRDIAMLGMLHRSALGHGPPQLRELFRRAPGGYQLLDPYSRCQRTPLIKRSGWGLIRVYNRLGSGAQSIKTVKELQHYLQERVKRLLGRGFVDDSSSWAKTYSPT